MAKRAHIIVIGGGFTGAALAIQLARGAVDVTVIEPRAAPGYGVAYSTTEPTHRINVPADRMQLADEPAGDFDRWYRLGGGLVADPQALWRDGKAYPQRGAFGRYVEERFHQAAQSGRARLRHLRDRALHLQPQAQGATVITAGGERLWGDYVVLATSHPPPALPRQIAPELARDARLIANPWAAEALDEVEPGEALAIVGTGLTMADTVAALHRRGHRGPITAFSRHGLLPRPNAEGEYPTWSFAPSAGLRDGVRQVRLEVARAARQRVPWQAVLDAVRAQGQRLWQALTPTEQQRFLRHLRAYWDVHRYRLAPQVSTLLAEQQAAGTLQVLAARLRWAERTPQGVRLTILPRQGAERALQAQRLLITTGPAHAGLIAASPLLRSLAEQGALRADPLGLGLWVNADSQAIGGDGLANPRLLVAGPAARGRFGELMGLPQVAEHAESVARHLLAAIAAGG
ncbi:FAD/NAD(P)-binding protein [Serratia ureilytica]|uniref:FAD/NAD(P)-binding protein n=1 Tax=Serratia ureilytica TaxID=300181 RepID=UPI003B27B33F